MKKYIFYILVAISLATVSGCNSFLDINTNPNQLTVVKPDFILSGALVTTAAIKSGGDINSYSGQWAGYTAASGTYSQSGDVVRSYILTTSYSVGVWGDIYSNLSNYNYVEKNVSGQKGYDNYVAICEIMKVYDFQNLVDIFGDVPYTQALTGFQYLYPKYDKAQAIYAKLSSKLDSAVNLIHQASAPVAVPKTTDVMFGGDMTMWVRLANTLRLRILLHQSEVSGFSPTADINAINANGGGYLGVGQDALINPGYSAAQNHQSPFWENYGEGYNLQLGSRDYTRASDYAVQFFTNTSDPRINYLFRSPGDNPGVNSKTGYVGVVFGSLPATLNNTAHTSSFGPGILKSAAQSAILISAAQSLFLQAEAAQRGWTADDAQALFNNGMQESFRILGVPSYATAAATFSSSGKVDVDFSASPNKLEAIITQKWAANYGVDDLEAWTDSRRLGSTGLISGVVAGIPLSQDPNRLPATTNPVRLLYPQTEYSSNATNVGLEGTIDQLSTRIFWDVN